MKKCLLIILSLFLNQIAESKYITNNTQIIDFPNHWNLISNTPMWIEGTNYLISTSLTNVYDTGINLITNVTTQGTVANDYTILYEFNLQNASEDMNPNSYYVTTQLVNEVSSGNLQLLPLSDLDNTLEIFGFNHINNVFNQDELINYAQNITSFPILATNGLIIKRFQYDWVNPTNNPDFAATAGSGIYYDDTFNSDIVVLDNSNIYVVEVGATATSDDLSFTTNIHKFVTTTDPIPQYYDSLILSPEERTYFANTNNESVYYVRIDFLTDANRFVYLDIADGELLNTEEFYLPMWTEQNNTNNNYAFYYEINKGDTGYNEASTSGLIKANEYPPETLKGPARIRFGFNGNEQRYLNNSNNLEAYILFRVERSDNYYLSLLESISEQLSNSISSSAETVFITNTVNQTSYVTNSYTNSVGYSLSEIQDLRIGSQTFGVSNGNAKIIMYVDESGNLTDWTNTPHVLELDIPADTDTKFFRFRMD